MLTFIKIAALIILFLALVWAIRYYFYSEYKKRKRPELWSNYTPDMYDKYNNDDHQFIG